MYDAIVIGARCAGSPTAMLLARKGYRVLLVDKCTFPSDTMSTHIIWQPGVARLARWGLLDRVIASNCPPIGNVTFDFGDFALTGSAPPYEGVAHGYAPRRKVLDKILVDGAVEAGAEFRESFSVQEILADQDRVVGIRGHDKGAATVTETGRIVVGADGMHSLVARAVRAPEYHTRSPLACYYYSYWSGVPVGGPEMYSRVGRAFGPIPTNDGLVCVTTAWTQREFREYRADIEKNFLKTLELSPDFAAKVRQGKREERFVGTGDMQNLLRKPYGAGWALVGDAGYHKDPITAQGITDAFRDAELLVDAIDAGFSGRRRLEDSLGDYERLRNEAALPMYEFTCQFAALDPPAPAMQQLFGALRSNQTETNRFIGTIAGTVHIPEFFSPDNMQRVIGAVNE
jgi:flavin-dependent dehydrogenase